MAIKYINNGKKILTSTSRKPMPVIEGAMPAPKIKVRAKPQTTIEVRGNVKIIIQKEEELKTIKEIIEDQQKELEVQENICVEETTTDTEEECEEETYEYSGEDTSEDTSEEEEVMEEASKTSLEDIGIKSRKLKKALNNLGIECAEDLLAIDANILFSEIPEGYIKRETLDNYIDQVKKLSE